VTRWNPGAPARRERLILTCEHAGNRIPKAHVSRFRGAEVVLESHRGWDPGALPLARRLARRLGVPLYAVRYSRLLVEANRSPHNPRIWSPYTEGLPVEERQRILDRYYWPHRRGVEAAVRSAIAAGRRVVHVAVHSFTPRIGGVVREGDVGLLYDPQRPRERALAVRWQGILRDLDPTLRVRRNFPYRGVADGLATWLRRRLPDARYAGFELEVNQAVFASSRRREVERRLGESLERLLEPRPRNAVSRQGRSRSRPAPRPRPSTSGPCATA
jgi:predicted N-formylglutamate amidohydrolase